MVNKRLLGKIIDALGNMIGYADDGTLSRYDDYYKSFFRDLDEANEVLEALNELYEADCYECVSNELTKKIDEKLGIKED